MTGGVNIKPVTETEESGIRILAGGVRNIPRHAKEQLDETSSREGGILCSAR